MRASDGRGTAAAPVLVSAKGGGLAAIFFVAFDAVDFFVTIQIPFFESNSLSAAPG